MTIDRTPGLDAMLARRFGTRLRALREHAGLTHPELADLASTSQKNISRLENGLTRPSLEMAQRLADALDENKSLACFDITPPSPPVSPPAANQPARKSS